MNYLEPEIISDSTNISLYPAIVKNNGLTVCTWYEYSSTVEPVRSDVFCATTMDHKNWSAPVNVSKGISYNNGPSIIHFKGYFIIAWHSWRSPGKEPFTPGGSISNIWLSQSKDGVIWSEPVLAFPELSGSRYASLVKMPDNKIKLFFYQQNSNNLNVSESIDGILWKTPELLPELIGNGFFPDVAVDSTGRHAFVWVEIDKPCSISLSISNDGNKWSSPVYMQVDEQDKLTRPKVAFGKEGDIWVTSHTNHWGSFTKNKILELDKTRLEIKIIPGNRAGSSCWTLNAIKLVPQNKNKEVLWFSFGPDVFKVDPHVILVTEENSLYSSKKGWGFDAPVKSILRELGNNITRTMVYCFDERIFTIDVDVGNYEVELVYSSWVSPIPDFSFEFPDGSVLRCDENIEVEKLVIFKVDKNLEYKNISVHNKPGYDNNRPAKLLISESGDEGLLTWTQYGSTRINIVSDRIAI